MATLNKPEMQLAEIGSWMPPEIWQSILWEQTEDGDYTASVSDEIRAMVDAGPTLDWLKDAQIAAIDTKRGQLTTGGFQHNFGGTAGVRTLDQRDQADEIAWLGQKNIADTLIAAGQGSTMLPFVDAGNAIFEASAVTTSAALLAMGLWRSSLVVAARTLKNAVLAADTAEELDAVDIEAGWPG